MHAFCVILIIFHVLCICVHRPVVAAEGDDEENRASFAAAEYSACGARACFLFGRLSGLSWDYSHVRVQFPSTEAGTSFTAIQEELKRQGIGCEVWRIDSSQLSEAPAPMIVFLRPDFAGSEIGHFMVLTKADVEGVSLIDPITGVSSTWGWHAFSDGWSGYCLVRTGSARPLEIGLTTIFLLHIVIFLYYVFPRRTLGNARSGRVSNSSLRTSRQAQKTDHQGSNLPILLMALFVFCPGLAFADQVRLHQRDGRNAAIILAGLCGQDVKELLDHDAGFSDSSPMSLLDLHRRAAEFSCRTVVRKLTFSELKSLPQPSVVLLRHDQTGRGQFCVVLASGADAITVAHAGPMLVESISEDEFRRRWTAHALVAAFTADADNGNCVLPVLGGALVALMLRLWFSRRYTSQANP